jgi:hypothetical protein
MKRRTIWITILIALITTIAGAVIAAPAHAAPCTTSTALGGCGPYYDDPSIFQSGNGVGNVIQDVWNPVPGWHQALTVNSMESWSAVANMPAGNTAVVSYPDTQETYTVATNKPDPMTDFPGLTSTYSHSDPPAASGQDYEWAYDIWLGDVNKTSWTNDQEVMVWTDIHGQQPAGTDQNVRYTAPDGAQYEVWADKGQGSTVGADNFIELLRTTNATSGTVAIGDIFTWLQDHGFTTPAAGVDQVDYGPELCSTNGQNATFTLNDYSISVSSGPTPSPTTTTPAPTTSPPPVPGGLSQTPHILVNFGWAGTGADSYEFQLYDSRGTLIASKAGLTTPHVSGIEVLKDAKYHWRVRNAGGAWSAFRYFTSP